MKGLLQTSSLALHLDVRSMQDPYVKIFFGLDTGRVWSTSPQVAFRDVRFAGLSLRFLFPPIHLLIPVCDAILLDLAFVYYTSKGV